MINAPATDLADWSNGKDNMVEVIIAVLALALGSGGTFAALKLRDSRKESAADQVLANAKNKASEIILNASKSAKREADELRREVKKSEDKVAEREHALLNKIEELDARAERVRQSEQEVEELKGEVLRIKDQAHAKLEKIAGLTKQQAADKVMALAEKETKDDLVGLVGKLQRDAEQDAEQRAEMIIVTAMERMASEVSSERTITAIKLPDDDMKGRIIGKEGRNIQALQRATGVDVLVDDTPGMVVLSSFDPVRRQVARLALEMLMKDGRIHPARIEEVVEKAQK